eukprot:TRINITY_DN11239_c0_g2_i2.p1 TRINITY_DN11239_c0_g2~~TRINITY_DN11239_c0_g2_i2.p1  ORF type:complete len:251 (-),score=110.67 TRINITY_DN11239_c0_g2_i2:51-803(-)
MGKKRKHGSSEEDSSDAKKKKKEKDKKVKHEEKKEKKEQKDEGKKDKKEEKKEDKKDKKEKKDDDKKDKKDKKAIGKEDEKKDKKDKKEKGDKKEDVFRPNLPAEPPKHLLQPATLGSQDMLKEKKEKDKKSKKDRKSAPVPSKEVELSAKTAFRDASRPFGIELDGSLVVDLDDEGAAIPAGVMIGWRVQEVEGKAVPEDEVGKAEKALREAEEKMAKKGGKAPVSVVFITEEPDHWKQASKNLAGRRH